MCQREHWSEHISTLGDLCDFESLCELHTVAKWRVEVIAQGVAVRTE